MVYKKELFITICIIIISTIIIIIITWLLFIDGVNGISYGTTSPTTKNNSTLINLALLIISENSGFATHHYIENFLFQILFSSSVLYIPLYSRNKKTIFYLFFIFLLSQIAYASLWELLEKFVIYLTNIIIEIIPGSEFIYKYTTGGEHFLNSWLSDISQAILSNIVVSLYISLHIIEPLSKYLSKRTILNIIFRIILYIITGLSTILTFIKKEFNGVDYVFNFGLYIHIFLRLIFFSILYIDDIMHNINEKREINKVWIMILGFIIILWISTLDLHLWGIITSNISSVLYLFIWMIINKVIS